MVMGSNPTGSNSWHLFFKMAALGFVFVLIVWLFTQVHVHTERSVSIFDLNYFTRYTYTCTCTWCSTVMLLRRWRKSRREGRTSWNFLTRLIDSWSSFSGRTIVVFHLKTNITQQAYFTVWRKVSTLLKQNDYFNCIWVKVCTFCNRDNYMYKQIKYTLCFYSAVAAILGSLLVKPRVLRALKRGYGETICNEQCHIPFSNRSICSVFLIDPVG